MCVLFIINLVAIIIPLWSSENTMIILYRMAIFCNLAVFVPSITLIYREKGHIFCADNYDRKRIKIKKSGGA